MDEKKKKPSSKYSFWRIFAYVALAILAIPLACGSLIYLVVAYDEMRMHQCFEEGEPLEWNGLIDFPALAGQTPISQSNLSELRPLPYYPDTAIFPELGYSTPLSHPEHDYFLSANTSNIELYARPKLIVCQPDGWASHILSSYVRSYRFSPDGSLFATIGYQDEIKLYDATTIEFLSTHTMRRSASVSICCFAFHPTEPLIVFIAYEHLDNINTLHFWNYETQEEVASNNYGGLHWANALAFNEEGNLLIARSRYGTEMTITVWGIPPE